MAQPTIVADITETSVQINEGQPLISLDIGTSPVSVNVTPSTIAANQTQPLVQVTLVPNPSLTVTVGHPAIIVDVTGVGGNTDWNGIVNKPSTFPPTLPIAESGVTNLVSDLAGKVGTSDPRLSDARTPLVHASTHAHGGSDPVTITYSDLASIPSTFTPSAHASTHAHGGSDPVTITYSDLSGIPSTFAPSAHHTSHQHGGSDAVSITYSDLLSIPSSFAPSAHETSHITGGSDIIPAPTTSKSGLVPVLPSTSATSKFLRGDATFVAVDYSALTSVPSTFTPAAHATTHESGGTDVIAIDLLGAASDNTNLNVSTSAHGLVPKAPNLTAQYLRGDGTWSIVPTATSTAGGLVPTPPNNTTTFLRGDASFAAVAYSALSGTPSTFTPSGHHTTHEHGGSDPVSITYSDLLSIPSTFAPSAHETSHITGGSDVIPAPTTSASGLVPVLPASSATSKFLRGDASFVAVDYSNLTSVPTSFTPSAHHASHQPGGSDQVTLAYSGQATLNFGSADNGGSDVMTAKTTVSATWLTASSFPTASLCTGLDHTDADDILVEELTAYVANLVIGTSFDIIVTAPNGSSGQYAVNYFSNY